MPLLESVRVWLPEVALSVGGLAALLGVFGRRRNPALLIAWLSLLAAAVALGASPMPAGAGEVFFGLIRLDALSGVARWLAFWATTLTLILVSGSPEVDERWMGEYIGLVLFVGAGMMLMAESHHLLMAVVAMELVSLSGYCLVALGRDARGSEAALKYLLFGALSSGLMLFGLSLLYGLTGALEFGALRAALEGAAPSSGPLLMVAAALVLAGLAFKISMVPFHMWTPDVYEGAPLPVTALLSVGPKAAGMALLLRLSQALGPAWDALQPALIVLTIATMTLGNLAALSQTNIKRLLAYSTIAQVGYILIGLIVRGPSGVSSLLVYLAAYLVMNMGIFACAAAACRAARTESIEAFRGLAQRSPWLAAASAVCLLSLAGLPPLVGFIGKLLLFGAAIESGHVALAVAGAANSAVALYYYVNLIRLMYLQPPAQPAPLSPGGGLATGVALCAAATVLLGLFPSGLLDWVRAAASVFQ